jgi:hypothetical protein
MRYPNPGRKDESSVVGQVRRPGPWSCNGTDILAVSINPHIMVSWNQTRLASARVPDVAASQGVKVRWARRIENSVSFEHVKLALGTGELAMTIKAH